MKNSYNPFKYRSGVNSSPAAAFFAGLQGATQSGLTGGMQEVLSHQHEQDQLQRLLSMEKAKADIEEAKQQGIDARSFVNNYGVPPEDQGAAANYLLATQRHPAETLATLRGADEKQQALADWQALPRNAGQEYELAPGQIPDSTLALLQGRTALEGATRINRGRAPGAGKSPPDYTTSVHGALVNLGMMNQVTGVLTPFGYNDIPAVKAQIKENQGGSPVTEGQADALLQIWAARGKVDKKDPRQMELYNQIITNRK